MSQPFRVSFVCTGNICRSPMGEVILRELLEREGLSDNVVVDSSGIQGWHEGNPADPRTLEALERGGYDGSAHRAHRLTDPEVGERDLLLVADRGHLTEVQRMAARSATPPQVRLLREFDPDADKDEVDDPYYGDEAGFDRCRDEIETACKGVVDHLRSQVPTG
ncbi:low molecular weight phosphotyrosine protein phosphatase [Yimella sp. cx-573]|nr:low molecular weight phosphotyrosine protein phosphatase [Yimella sp. cx-573]